MTGVLLVLVSVLVGARVVSAADRSVPVWAAAHDLAAGMTLHAEDLREVPARLFDTTSVYLPSSSDPTGRVLDRPVRAGELMPASALRELTDRVSIALPIDAQKVPLGLQRGQLVDVYASTDGSNGAQAQTRLVLDAAPVQAVDGGNQGSLGIGSGMRQVVVSLPGGQAAQVLSALSGADLTLAILDDLSPRGPNGVLPTPITTSTVPTNGAPTSSVPTNGAPASSVPTNGAPASTAPASTAAPTS